MCINKDDGNQRKGDGGEIETWAGKTKSNKFAKGGVMDGRGVRSPVK